MKFEVGDLVMAIRSSLTRQVQKGKIYRVTGASEKMVKIEDESGFWTIYKSRHFVKAPSVVIAMSGVKL